MRKSGVRSAVFVFSTLALLRPAAAADGEGPWGMRFVESVWANATSFSPAYITPKCLVPYPVCKFAIAAASLVSSWEQIIMGGDFKGAQDTLGRGLGGPWLVQPKHVTGEVAWAFPGVIPLPYYFATGQGNAGAVALDPLPSSEQSHDTAGDVLPP